MGMKEDSRTRENRMNNRVGKGPSTTQPGSRTREQEEKNAPKSQRKGNTQEANSNTTRPTPTSAEHTRAGEQVISLKRKERAV